MASEVAKIINRFCDVVVGRGDFTVDGIEDAFYNFVKALEINEINEASRFVPGFVKSSIDTAVDAAKKPVYITFKVNQYGNKESTMFPGLLLTDEGVVYGYQDGPNIGKLSMNHLLVCQANGFRYDKNNTIGSAQHTSSALGQVQ